MAKYQIKVEQMLESIMPIFLKSVGEDLVKLESAVESSDFATLKALGHKVKGSAGGYGFEQLGQMAKDLEFAAKESDLSSCQNKLQEMKEFMSDYEIIYQDDE